jgi:transcriptional regulator with XRE-family HTH domain
MALDMKLDTDLVRKLREDRGWSQEHLAAVSGLSARTVQRLEAEGNASLESRSALAAAFGVDPGRLNAGGGSGSFGTAAAASGSWPNAWKWALAVGAILLCVLYLSQMFGKFLYYATH